MAKDKLKTIYVCTQCGETSPRWLGRCPSCGAWNTMVEDVVAEPAKPSGGKAAAPARVPGQTSLTPLKLNTISTTEEKSRIVTGIGELDRVLGGGIVLGSVTLIGGEPGIGKSTILLQLCGEVSRSPGRAVCHRGGIGAADQAAGGPAGRAAGEHLPGGRKRRGRDLRADRGDQARPGGHRLHPDHALRGHLPPRPARCRRSRRARPAS